MKHREQPSQRPQQAAGSGERVMLIRRRRRLRQLKLFLATVLLIALLVGYFTGAFHTPLMYLSEWFVTARLSLSTGPQLPQPHQIEDPQRLYPLGKGAVVLGRREAVLYAANGAQLRRIPFGFDRPGVTAGDTRVCIYNRSGRQLTVEGRTRSLYTHTMQEAILLAQMSKNGRLAVATKSALTVFDDAMESIWSWKSAGETPLCMGFSPSEQDLAVASLHAQDGALGAQLHFFNLKSDAIGAQATLTGGLPLQIHYLSRTRVLVVCDTFAALYDPASGEQTARYDYGTRVLQSAAVHSSGAVALLFGGGDYATVSTLVLLDKTLAETSATTRTLRTRSVRYVGETVLLLAENAVYTFGSDGVYYGESKLEEPLVGLAGDGGLLATNTALLRFDAPARPQQEKD